MQLEYTRQFKYAYRIAGYLNNASTAPVDFFINARIIQTIVNTLNAELNRICPLLGLFGAHQFSTLAGKGLINNNGIKFIL